MAELEDTTRQHLINLSVVYFMVSVFTHRSDKNKLVWAWQTGWRNLLN